MVIFLILKNTCYAISLIFKEKEVPYGIIRHNHNNTCYKLANGIFIKPSGWFNPFIISYRSYRIDIQINSQSIAT
jgi:hypothetical protein